MPALSRGIKLSRVISSCQRDNDGYEVIFLAGMKKPSMKRALFLAAGVLFDAEESTTSVVQAMEV